MHKLMVKTMVQVNLAFSFLFLMQKVSLKERVPSITEALEYLSQKRCRWIALYETRTNVEDNATILTTSKTNVEAKMISDVQILKN